VGREGSIIGLMHSEYEGVVGLGVGVWEELGIESMCVLHNFADSLRQWSLVISPTLRLFIDRVALCQYPGLLFPMPGLFSTVSSAFTRVSLGLIRHNETGI
jgi:hypothetical protein